MEVWLQPRLNNASGTVLGFYGPGGLQGISLHQWQTELRLDSRHGSGRPTKRYVDEIFRAHRLVFVTVVAGPTGAAVYRDGWPVGAFPDLTLSPDVCSGRFVVGDSPEEDSTLEGTFHGLAIYARELTADQVRSSYWSWRKYGTPVHSGNPQPEALYLFNEGRGRAIQDHGQGGVHLAIPERYTIARKVFLKSPLRAFQETPGYFGDVAINVAGFLPLGFLAAASFALQERHSGWIAGLAGLAVSLAIEVGQMYLPTRNSDLTDILTNTLGAVLGGICWQRVSRRLTTRPQ